MKLDRLIGIITELQQKKRVTAPYLAEKFEVSRRTINRDVEDLCKAGIPVVTTQGAGGGIAIMDGFNLDTTVFTEEELAAVFTGLKAFDSVSLRPSARRLAGKFGDRALRLADPVQIDLSSFYKESLADKIELLKQAVTDRRCVRFHYFYDKGEADKCIEPYLIVFKWSDWYVFGWCRERRDFRMYKLRRLWELCVTDETYEPREIPEEKKRFGRNSTDEYLITAIYDPSVKYRLVEEYGPHSFTVLEDGRLWTRWGYADPDSAMLWHLGFGEKVQVIEPPEMVEKMKAMIGRLHEAYGANEMDVTAISKNLSET